MNHQNIKAGTALKGKNGFAFRSASDTRIFNICHILSSGTVTHLDQDPFIIQLRLNYKGSSQTKSTLKMGLKKTVLQRSSEPRTLPQTMSGRNKENSQRGVTGLPVAALNQNSLEFKGTSSRTPEQEGAPCQEGPHRVYSNVPDAQVTYKRYGRRFHLARFPYHG